MGPSGRHRCSSVQSPAAPCKVGDVSARHFSPFEDFPKLRPWFDRMAKLPFHENVHRYNVVFGDILSRPNTLERFMAAGTAGIAALAEVGVPIHEDG